MAFRLNIYEWNKNAYVTSNIPKYTMNISTDLASKALNWYKL